jgi:O-antigen/teichoic acid export membrane protein
VRIRSNIIANYAGQGWAALMGLIFAPVYIRLLGIEAYGLIGFFTMLQVWLALLDLGMAPTSVREMARFTSGVATVQATRDLLRSFELICLGIGALIIVVFAAASGPIGAHWLNTQSISDRTAAQAVALIGFVLATRLVEGVFRSCLIGLQRQVLLNIASAALATVRSVGVIGVLYWVDRSIQAFFLWQAALSLISVAVFALAVHRTIPAPPRPARFSPAAIASVGRFAGGMLGINFLAILLTQVDKVILSRLLPLAGYGNYMLATAVVGVMYVFTGPITQAAFPAMVEHAAAKDEPQLARIFQHSTQFMTIVLAPMGLVLILFARPLLFAWTGDPSLSAAVAPLVSLLAVGTLLNTFMQIPYYAQIAHGWTGLALRANLVAVIILIPLLLWLVPEYGALAAAAIWAILNLFYLLIVVPIMFRRILRGHQLRWYLRGLIVPVMAALLILGAARLVPLEAMLGRAGQGLFVVAAAAVAFGAAALTLDGAFATLRRMLLGLRRARAEPGGGVEGSA